MHKVHVDLGERSYDIHITPHALDHAGEYIAARLGKRRCLTVMDSNLYSTQWPRLKAALEKEGYESTHIILEAGEATKSYANLEKVVEAILAAKLERNDFIIAFGGGVIGDLAGFAAAITRRGMAFVQIPTSLLAQVDSSVGGKTGINSPHGKNLIGAFHQPALVLIDPTVLDTLSERHRIAGYAEVVKYALIDNYPFFEWLETNGSTLFDNQDNLCEAIKISCESKAKIVALDEREGGKRALLNLGHTFGHALEKLTGYSDRLVHGEAIAIGMMMALYFCQGREEINGQDVKRVENHFKTMKLPTYISDIDGDIGSAEDILNAMYQDKKVEQGKLTLILTEGLSNAYIAKDVAGDEVFAFLLEFQKALRI